MALRYTNGPNPFDGPKTISLIVNGTSRQITLPATGAWTNYRLYVDGVTLQAGANTIELKHATDDVGHVNLDSLRLAPAGVQRYEAEAATLAGGARVETEHAGFSGAGYVGGYQNEGANTTFKVTALADAETEVVLGYANGPNPAPGTKEVSLYVNGQFVKKLALPDTGAWNVYGTLSDTLMLRAGSNDISIRYDAGDDGNVNLDYLDVTQNEPVQCPPTFEPERRVRRQRAGPLPLVDDPRRGSVRLLPRRRQAADQGAGRRHRGHARSRRATSCSSRHRPTAAGRRRRSSRSAAPTTTSRAGSSRTRARPTGASSS